MNAVVQDQIITQEQPLPLSINLVLPGELSGQIAKDLNAVALAREFDVDCVEVANAAASEATRLAKRIDWLKGQRKDFVKPAKDIIAKAEALFTPSINALEEARGLLLGRVSTFQIAEQKRIADENAKREAEARRARQEADQKAAEARARAEEIARSEREKAQAAELARQKAEAEGNTRAAAAAAAASAAATGKAQAAVENAEVKATEAVLAAAATAPMTPIDAPKIAGISLRDNWIAERAQGETEESAKAKIVAAAGNNPMLLGFLKLDDSAIQKHAKSVKTHFNVPGFKARNEQIAAGSRK